MKFPRQSTNRQGRPPWVRKGRRAAEPDGGHPALCPDCGARLMFVTDANGRVVECCLLGCGHVGKVGPA